MRNSRKIGLVGVLGATALMLGPQASPTLVSAQAGPAQKAAHNQLRIQRVQTAPGVVKTLPSLSGSTVQTALDSVAAARADAQTGAGDTGAGAGPVGGNNSPVTANQLGVAPRSLGCSQRDGKSEMGNVRVNQDCTYRRNAEEIVKFNPIDPNNLIAGQNDSRLGYNKCGFDYSFDGGHLWGDGNPPFQQKQNNPLAEEPTPADPNRHTIVGGPGTDHTYDAFSDPALAFDSQGRAFYSCLGFDISSNASGLFVTASPAGAGGSFYNNVTPYSRRYVVAEDNNGAVFHDKQFIAADAFPNSPNRDNVYVTWTVFKADPSCNTPDYAGGSCSPIFGSMSTDHGRTWSTPEEISSSSSLCALDQVSVRPCNQDQGSDPIVLPDGTLSVVFNNTNTGKQDPNAQQLSLKCRPSGSSPAGTAHLNCSDPARVGTDFSSGEPLCDFGRGPEECIPGAYIRTNDFPRIAVNRDSADPKNAHLYATWQDYRTGEFDIHLAQSVDGGLTWHEAAAPVNPDAGRDHYFPAIDVAASPLGTGSKGSHDDHVGVSYYRTDRVPGESTSPLGPSGGGFGPGDPGVQTGNSDYNLAGGRSVNTPYKAETISPQFPPPNGNQAGFNGDYSGLVVVNDVAHPIWSDTRNAVPPSVGNQGTLNDEDVFTVTRGLPAGS